LKYRVFALLFHRQGNASFPAYPALHRLVVKWAEKNFDYQVNFSDYQASWVACAVDEGGNPVEVKGVMCGQPRWDFPVVRYTDPEAAKMMFDRVEGFLHDAGNRGQEVFVHLSEGGSPENLCPMREEMLKEFKAEPANRWSVIVR